MDEVLEKMDEDTSAAINRDERELFIIRIKQGQIYDYKREHERALTLWGNVLEEVKLRVKTKRAEASQLKGPMDGDTSSSSLSTSDDSDDAQDERRARKCRYLRTKLGHELRDLQDLQHRATFMMASANFQLKNEKEEIRLYGEAEHLRHEVITWPIRLILRSCAIQSDGLTILLID